MDGLKQLCKATTRRPEGGEKGFFSDLLRIVQWVWWMLINRNKHSLDWCEIRVCRQKRSEFIEQEGEGTGDVNAEFVMLQSSKKNRSTWIWVSHEETGMDLPFPCTTLVSAHLVCCIQSTAQKRLTNRGSLHYSTKKKKKLRGPQGNNEARLQLILHDSLAKWQPSAW